MSNLAWSRRLTEGSESDRCTCILERFFAALVAFWNIPLLSGGWRQIGFFAILSLCCLVRTRIGLAGTQMFSHDVFAILDPAWRMLHGQRPHVDFYSHLGVLTYIPTVVGIWLSHGRAQGFGYGLGLTAWICGVWVFLIGRQRISDMPLAVLSASTVLMVADPSSLGFSPLLFAPAMIYNRIGYALTAILLVEVLLPPAKRNSGTQYASGFSTGLLIGFLLFLKINFFIAAAFLLLALQPSRFQVRTRIHGILTGFLVVLLINGVYLRFQFLAMARDLLLVIRAKHINLSFYAIDQIMLSAGTLLVIALMTDLVWKQRASERQAIPMLRAGFAVCIAGGLLIFGNYEPAGFPMLPFFAVLCLGLTTHPEASAKRSRDRLYAAMVVLASISVLVPFTSGVLALGNGLVQKFAAASLSPLIDAPLLYGFVPQGDEWYRTQVNDGLTLVRKYRKPGETVMSLDFTNAFSTALQADPAPGGAVALQYGTTFDDLHRPWAERLFGKADLVMLPKSFSDPTLTDSIPRLYGPYLEEHFRPVGESIMWRLYRRAEPDPK